MVTFLIIWYGFNILCGVGLTVYTAIEGPIENGPGTYVLSTLFSIGLLLGVIFLL